MTTNVPRGLRLAGLVLTSLALSCSAPKAERIVLITLDTLRSDSFLGTPERPSSMPRTLALASRGAIYDHYYSATSVTQPAHASILTGLHPWQHGLTRNGQRLKPEVETVAESLRAAGWHTAAIVASFPLAGRFGFDQGFGTYDDHFDHLHPRETWEDYSIPGQQFYSLAETITGKAITLLDQLSDNHQLIWIHYFDPHLPYGDSAGLEPIRMVQIMRPIRRGQPVDAILKRARRAYEADVTALDGQLSGLLERLTADSDRFVTHIIVVADHGESFGEGGALAHGKRLTPEQIQVPLFILSPRIKPGRNHRITGSVDIAATLLDLAGLPYPEPAQSLLIPPQHPASAVGMRRTYVTPVSEERLDGTKVPLHGHRFFAVDRDGRLVLGNGRELRPTPTSKALSSDERDRRLALFAHFEEQLDSVQSESVTDDESQRALHALGYVD